MKIALIGYGEVGRILAEDLRRDSHVIAAFDVKASSGTDVSMRDHVASHGVVLAETAAHAVEGTELVISAVTASQTVVAAEACVSGLAAGCFYLDFNSASPGAKLAAAELVGRGGGRYVEGAVMTSVPPYRLRVPLLLGGPDAEVLEPVLRELGFSPKVASSRFGVVSATKMCRSVIIKGLEAMVIESLTAARHYGVEDAVLASLSETFPEVPWERHATYFFQRAIEHGRRRCEEMREVAVTIRDAGLEPWSAAGTADRQGWVAELADRGVFGARGSEVFAKSPDWRTEVDRLLSHLQASKG